MAKKRIIISILVIMGLLIITLSLPKIYSDIYISPTDGTTNDTFISPGYTSEGSALILEVGNFTNRDETRGLIKFNISGVPSSDTILNAKVQLYVSSSTGGSQNRTIKLYRLTSNWVESTANWTNNDTNSRWKTNGGDYFSTQVLNYTKITNELGLYYNFSIPVDIIKGWLNGTYPNYGIIITSNDSQPGNFTIIASSNSVDPSTRPIIIISDIANAVSTINNISTWENQNSPTNVGSKITFTINWTDLENDNATIYVCNSQNINYSSGCQGNLFCSNYSQGSIASTVSTCSYTAQNSDNTTSSFYVGACDTGSKNCSVSNLNYFYVNHAPTVILTQPNSQGIIINSTSYAIKFNVSDPDNPGLSNFTAEIYYGKTQNSTNYTIESIILDSSYCTDADSKTSTPNNCSYIWAVPQLWGDYYITIILTDNYLSSNSSSNYPFKIHTINDNKPPELSSPWIDSNDIHSGKTVQFFANATDESGIGSIWVTIYPESASEINITMNNFQDDTYYANWTATQIGNYTYKVYAEDIIGNINNSIPEKKFSIRRPNATAQNELSPQIALPYSIIKISGELNATDSLKGVTARLNTPKGFTFLNNYPQNATIGDFNDNETKEADWIISAPFYQGNYQMNITYFDNFSNSYQSSNFNVSVNSSIGGGDGGNATGYFLTVSGYPYVSRGENYTAKAYFTQDGNFANPDTITITMKDPVGSKLSDHPALMDNLSIGIFNYTRKIDTTWLEGQWETIINATKNGHSYYAQQFWRVVGTLFDVRNITITNPSTEALSIGFILENKGAKPEDMRVLYNLTKESTGEVLGTYSETVGVNAGESKQWSVFGKSNPSNGVNTRGYVGEARITIVGSYPGGRAGAYQIFNLTSENYSCGDSSCNNGETCSSCPQDCGVCPSPSSGGGGGGGSAGAINQTKQFKSLNITKFDPIIYLTPNLNKKVYIEIKNTGTIKLTNISLTLENLNKSIYSIFPLFIDSLNPNETKTFEIDLLIKDIIEEQDFNYIASANGIQAKEPGRLIVLSIKDYFLRIINSLDKRISDIKESTNKKDILNSLKKCEEILNQSKSDFENGKYTGLEENLNRADDCITVIENKLKEMPIIKLNYIGWVVTWIVFIIIVIIIIYYLRKKLRIAKLIKSDLTKSKNMPKEKRTMEQKYFEDKIKNIEEKLSD